uniref:Uncharacterized protein n=1 Tax=Rhizophora mucronata TaxID=61149 RepID=A0A2P2QQ62_RHIMU
MQTKDYMVKLRGKNDLRVCKRKNILTKTSKEKRKPEPYTYKI